MIQKIVPIVALAISSLLVWDLSQKMDLSQQARESLSPKLIQRSIATDLEPLVKSLNHAKTR